MVHNNFFIDYTYIIIFVDFFVYNYVIHNFKHSNDIQITGLELTQNKPIMFIL